MFPYRGKTALVTGASSGIGETFAWSLARRGMDLVLVARSEQTLRTMAAAIARRHGVRVEVVAVDLAADGAARHIHEATSGLGMDITVLVNNAGFGTHGRFDQIEPERDHRQVLVNVAAVVDLTHLYLAAMVERGEGAVFNLASIVSFWPLPYEAVYGASKAFVLSFSRALSEELRGSGVHCIAVCPGATATGFLRAMGDGVLQRRADRLGMTRSSQQVVWSALIALERGRPVAIDGAVNRAMVAVRRLLPIGLVTRGAAVVIGPRNREHGQ